MNSEMNSEFGENETEKVESWRLRELMDAGWPVAFAEIIAPNQLIDLHEACNLIRQGIEKGDKPETILKIIWMPDDQEPPVIISDMEKLAQGELKER